MLTRRFASLLLAALLWPVGAGPAHAQASPDIHGVVTDSSGGVVVGATVTLATENGVTRVTMTDPLGRYRFMDLTPGPATLSLAMEGFETFHATVDVRSGRQTVFDIVLQVGFHESVEVTTASATESDDGAGRTLTGRELAALPSDPQALLRRLQDMVGATGADDMTVLVDGFEQNDGVPRRESIQSIRLVASGFDAEFAEPGRGRVEILTRSSADKVDANLNLDFNDDRLNAKNRFAPVRVPARSRTVSAAMRAPLVAKRWAIAAYGDRSDDNAPSIINAVVLAPWDLSPRSESAVLAAPQSSQTLQLRTDYQRSAGERLTVSYTRSRGSAGNQGLEGGFDLPSRAFENRNDAHAVRASWMLARPRTVHDLRVEWRRGRDRTEAVSSDAAVVVLDAFSAGGNQDQLFSEGRYDTLQFADRVALLRGRHSIKAGVTIDGGHHLETARTGVAGTFLFGADVERDATGAVLVDAGGATTAIAPIERYRRTLLHLPGYGPSQFTIGGGDPTIAYSQWWAAWFVQDDWSITPQVTLSTGLRHSLQTQVATSGALAPRVAATWKLDAEGRNRVRGGAGLFYHRIPTVVFVNERRYTATGTPQRIVQQPQFFPQVPDTLGLEAGGRTTYRLPADLTLPRSLLSSVTWDHRLASDVRASVGVAWERGTRLLRRRNLHATPNGDAGLVGTLGADPIFQYDAAGFSSRRELTTSLYAKLSERATASFGYTWSVRRGNTEGPASTPTDAASPDADDGYLSSDRRHRAVASLWLQFPWQIGVSSYATLLSGRPFDITTGRDTNGDTVFNERPAFASAGDPGAIPTPFGVFNPVAAPGDAVIPRNFGREPRQIRVDLHVTKAINADGARSSGTLEVAVENLLNNANLGGVIGTLSSPRFGLPQRSGPPRRITLSAGWYF